MVLAVKGPKDKAPRALSNTKLKVVKEKVFIPIQPKDGVAAIYRNFIDKTTPRAIGIGFPVAHSPSRVARCRDNGRTRA